MSDHTSNFYTKITLQMIYDQLKLIANSIEQHGKTHLLDINIIAEGIFCRLLNLLYDYNLYTQTTESPNYVAIDLVDWKKQVAYQVTSRDATDKIRETLDKFNEKQELYENIKEIKFLVLKMSHNYRKENESLKNGQNFSYQNDILTLDKLYGLIEEKINNDQFPDKMKDKIYGILMMFSDSGIMDMEFDGIEKYTDELDQKDYAESRWQRASRFGFGDVAGCFFIPLDIDKHLSCEIWFRRYDISGIFFTLNEDEILCEYFVDKNRFMLLHKIGIQDSLNMVWLQIKGARMLVNKVTVDHLYEVFMYMKNDYESGQQRILEKYDAQLLKRRDGHFFVKDISGDLKDNIFKFAGKHRCTKETRTFWDVFNIWVNSDYMRIEFDDNVHAIFKFKKMIDNSYAVYWEPPAPIDSFCYDAKTMWTGDYAKRWFDDLIKQVQSEDSIINYSTRIEPEKGKQFLSIFAGL